MRCLFVLAFAAICSAAVLEDGKIIYDTDDRQDYYQASAAQQTVISQSIVALVKKTKLSCSGGVCNPASSVQTLQNSLTMCSGQNFNSQLTLAFCSGFLIDNDRIATAGHCITSPSDCEDAYFVFNYHHTSSSGRATISETADVYECKRHFTQLYTASDGTKLDWAVIQLDRAVDSSHVPLSVATASYSLNNGAALTMIGYPSGLPAKVASSVVTAQQTWGFYTVTDAFGGNSGSAIMDSSNTVVGILVRGNTDYAVSGSCRVTNVVSSSEFASTSVEQASWVSQLITRGGPTCTSASDCPNSNSCLLDSGLLGFCNVPSQVCSGSGLCTRVHTTCYQNGTSTYGSCRTCGHTSVASSSADADDCRDCHDGYEIDVVYTDCTGRCVPTGTAATPPSESICPEYFPVADCSVCGSTSGAVWLQPLLFVAGALFMLAL